jgi:hypothetical protein
MPAKKADPTAALAAREIVSTRIVSAARGFLIKAFRDPDNLADALRDGR